MGLTGTLPRYKKSTIEFRDLISNPECGGEEVNTCFYLTYIETFARLKSVKHRLYKV